MVDLSLPTFFDKYPQLKQQNVYAVAVSGGPDSMALAHLVIEYAKNQNKKIHILTVDHGLRDAAKAEAGMVAQWCKNFDNMVHATLPWEGEKPESGMMEAAREARYALMATYCATHNISTLFIAHHQDDQAETFLFRLSKGSGLDGLAGIREKRIYNETLTLMRPLLYLNKQDLVDYCARHDIPFAKDPTNQDVNYMRPRLRQTMEILAAEGLTAKRLSITAKRLGRAKRALQDISNQVYTDALLKKEVNKYILDFTLLKLQPEEIAFRVIQKTLEQMRPDADYNVRMEKLEELFESLMSRPESFKPRTLGGCIFALKDKNTALWLEREMDKNTDKKKAPDA